MLHPVATRKMREWDQWTNTPPSRAMMALAASLQSNWGPPSSPPLFAHPTALRAAGRMRWSVATRVAASWPPLAGVASTKPRSQFNFRGGDRAKRFLSFGYDWLGFARHQCKTIV